MCEATPGSVFRARLKRSRPDNFGQFFVFLDIASVLCMAFRRCGREQIAAIRMAADGCWPLERAGLFSRFQHIFGSASVSTRLFLDDWLNAALSTVSNFIACPHSMAPPHGNDPCGEPSRKLAPKSNQLHLPCGG